MSKTGGLIVLTSYGFNVTIECDIKNTTNVFHYNEASLNLLANVSDLTNMYTLLKPIHKGLEVLLRETEGHIRHQGMESVASLKNDPSVSYNIPL